MMGRGGRHTRPQGKELREVTVNSRPVAGCTRSEQQIWAPCVVARQSHLNGLYTPVAPHAILPGPRCLDQQ